MKVKWLDRDTIFAPYTTLCLSEAAYLAVAKHCRISPDQWLDESAQQACVHTWSFKWKLVCVVCLHPDSIGAEPIHVAETLVHESVHIFQRLCDSIGEDKPGREFQAYTVERIAGRLMREFVRQTSQPKKTGGDA